MCLNASGQRYLNIYAEMRGPIDWKSLSDSVAPNVPGYLFSTAEENTEYKEIVVQWIYDHPDEFDEARMIDYRLNKFVGWALKTNGKRKGEGPSGNPRFVYYPVNEQRPVFIDTKNPDQDSLIFNHKTQNWIFTYHQDEYVEKYGDLPEILGYPKPIKHPDEFSSDYGRSNIDWYYPEFSTDSRVFSQYEMLYNQQFGSNQPENK
jgi:hypothetical protein